LAGELHIGVDVLLVLVLQRCRPLQALQYDIYFHRQALPRPACSMCFQIPYRVSDDCVLATAGCTRSCVISRQASFPPHHSSAAATVSDTMAPSQRRATSAAAAAAAVFLAAAAVLLAAAPAAADGPDPGQPSPERLASLAAQKAAILANFAKEVLPRPCIGCTASMAPPVPGVLAGHLTPAVAAVVGAPLSRAPDSDSVWMTGSMMTDGDPTLQVHSHPWTQVNAHIVMQIVCKMVLLAAHTGCGKGRQCSRHHQRQSRDEHRPLGVRPPPAAAGPA
jgi:hypothetical protein